MLNENLIQFGFAVTVGVSVVSYLIWSARRQQIFLQTLIENHMSRNTAALNRLTEAVDALKERLSRTERLAGRDS